MRSAIWRHFDFWLFGVVVLLSIFGVAMIRSAVAGSPGLVGLVPRQIIFVGIGLVLTISITIVDYHYWRSVVRPLYVITLVLLIFTFVVAKAKFGAARWISAGLVDIQPAELAKIVIILALADYFDHTRDQPHGIRWIATSLALAGLLVVWIVLQPSLSNTIVIMVLWFALLWMSGLKTKYIAIAIAGLIIAVPFLFPHLQVYQQERILNFFVPDPNATYGDTYNVDQALYSVGSGGWFGMGYGHGTQVQLRFLKVRQSDFIFSAMAEEFGFVGTSIVMILLLFVILRIVRTARRASDLFGALIAFGFGTLIFFQVAVNVGVNLQVIPVTGLTLPFISYGGSSLVTLFMGIGLVESVALRQKQLEF
jgi:rod shape determining protein RodA